MSKKTNYDSGEAHPFTVTERPETNLQIRQISDPMEAPQVFGTKINGATPIVLVPRRTSCSLYVDIPHGSAAIVTRYGKFVGVYSPGFHWFPAWYAIQYLVNTQSIPYHFHIRECPTRDNVPIKIHIDIIFHVTDPHSFVYDIGPEKLEELLRASQAESVRSLVRSIKVSEAYDLRGAESEDMIRSLNDKIKAYGVMIDQVTIANVTLPGNIAVAMQSETTFESKQTEQRKKQEYELKVLNDNNFALRVKQDRDNERKKVVEEAKRQRILITQEIQQIEATAERVLAEIQSAQQYEVSKIQAEAKNECKKIEAEKDRIVLETKAKGESEVSKMVAETEKYTRQVKAGAKVVVAENNAKATELLGDAEQKAAEKLKARRKFDLEMENVQVWNSLANNSNILISTEANEPGLANQMFGMQQLSNILQPRK